MVRYIFLLFFSFILCAYSLAQRTDAFIEDSVDVTSNSDSIEFNSYYDGIPYNPSPSSDSLLAIHEKNLSEDSLIKWKARHYSYMKDIDSLLRASQKEPTTVRTGSSPNFGFISSLIEPLLWILGSIFVIFILYRLFATQGIFKRAPAELIPDAEPEAASLSETDFDEIIRRHVANKDYRAATRYWFLKTLQHLHDRQLIQYAIDKTNSRYVQELSPGLQQPFARLALNYEYVWFGHKEIGEETYRKIEQAFVDFNKTIV